jgi:hypothetical protein
VDLYYLGLWKSQSVFDDGIGRELRHSVGTRIWNNSVPLQYNFEALYQWGKFGTKKISAWTISSNTTYTIQSLKCKPQINFKAELISGDRNYDDGKLQTFNPLYPKGGYFGLANLIGPLNLVDIHPSLIINLTNTLEYEVDYDAFWRFSQTMAYMANPHYWSIAGGTANTNSSAISWPPILFTIPVNSSAYKRNLAGLKLALI